tara:strand:+ start:2145 stop:2369 length:225 start_codon:yes stop_codon:yes gene_type:complete
MELELLGSDLQGIERFMKARVDINKITAYWIIPAFVDEELELTVESDEMNILIDGLILTIKVNQDLIKLIDAKL